MSAYVELKAADGFVSPAYLAEPEGTPHGAVVLLQEIFGVNSHIRELADAYAAAGYVALAPSLFHRVQAGVELGYTDADMQAGFAIKLQVDALPDPGVMADIQAAIDTLRLAAGVKVGIVGYCWGGLLAWRSACQLQGLSAAVPYYGGGMTVGADAELQPQCPVLVHFAEQDNWIPLDTVTAFKARHPEVQVHTYAAHHGFNCDQRGAHDAPSAELALERTVAFLVQHLG